jgi:hypothetical protein
MTEINYYTIESTLKDILAADSRITDLGTTVTVEDSFNLITDLCPWIGIYLDSWDSPAEEERIGGTSPILTLLTLELWLYDFAIENNTAAQNRDTLLQKVKEVLKENRTISDTVLITRFAGGEFDSAATGDGFFMGVSIKLECEVRE